MQFTKFFGEQLPWKLLTVEALLVVLSVLLALALNGWRQAQADARVAQRAVQEFASEVVSNCERVRSVQAYHRAVVAGEREPEGIRIGLLRNGAWDIAKSTGAAAHLQHDWVARMVEVSALQADHRTIVQAYIQVLLAQGLQAKTKAQWHLEGERGVVSELLRIQDDLLLSYAGFLEPLAESRRPPLASACLP